MAGLIDAKFPNTHNFRVSNETLSGTIAVKLKIDLKSQTFKASASFIVFSNILMLNKYASGMHWMNGFAYATQGLLQLLLTILTFVTLFAALIFGLRDAGRYLPQMNPAVGLVVKVTLFIVFGFVLTEFSRTIFMFLSNVLGLNPFAGYQP